jgi:hypothetical protein
LEARYLMSSRNRHRLDSNHRDVIDALERLGYWFWNASQSNLGIDGFVVGHGRIIPVEIKDPKSSRRLQLTPHEAKIHQRLKANGVTVEILTGDNASLDVLRLPAREYYRP